MFKSPLIWEGERGDISWDLCDGIKDNDISRDKVGQDCMWDVA